MNITQFRNLTDPELIAHLDPITHRSPVILELVKRLQALNDDQIALENADDRLECPVCMAQLHIELDATNQLFICKVAPRV